MIPLQRLVIALGGHSSPAASVATALVRNCSIPLSDVQQMQPDGRIKLNLIDKKYSTASRSKSGRRGGKKPQRRPSSPPTEEERIKDEMRFDKVRQWLVPPQVCREFQSSLWCDRLMLGEPPTRSAVVVPASASVTNECVSRVLQHFRNLMPEDIILLSGVDVDDHDEDEDANALTTATRDVLFLGSAIDGKKSCGDAVSAFAVNEALSAVQWRFQQQKELLEDGKNDTTNQMDDDDDLSLVPLIHFRRHTSSASLQNKGNEGTADHHRHHPPLTDDLVSMITAMSCTHPEHAARAVQLYNDDALLGTVLPSSSFSAGVGSAAAGGEDDSTNYHSISNSIKLFQYSMLSVKDESILRANREPELMKAIVPGMPVSSVALRNYANNTMERVGDKQRYEDRVRAEAKVVLTKLGRV